MACSIHVIRALVNWAKQSPENKAAIVQALEDAIAANLAGKDKVVSASAEGSSFTRMTGGMSVEDQISCYNMVIEIIDNHNGVVPSSKSYARIF